jgi:hypothetical protein
MTQVSNKLRITTLAVLFTFCSMMTAVTTGAMAQPPVNTSRARQAASTYIQGPVLPVTSLALYSA